MAIYEINKEVLLQEDPFKPLPYSKTGNELAYSGDHAVPVGY